MILTVGPQQPLPRGVERLAVLALVAAGSFPGCGATQSPVVTATCRNVLPAAVDPTGLEGAWVEVLDPDPRRARRRSRARLTLVVSGTMLVERLTDRTVRQSLFTHLPGRSDAIDLTTVVDGELWLTRAIYKIDDDMLTLCEATRDARRPTVFRHGAGEDSQPTSLRKFKRL